MAFLCHELRNPLHAISNVCSFLEDTSLDVSQSEYCDAIQASTKYMSDLVSDVLDVGKFEAGQIQLEIIECDLQSLLRLLFLTFRNQCRQKNIQVQAPHAEVIQDF
jgi:signal transduction histidine kinase